MRPIAAVQEKQQLNCMDELPTNLRALRDATPEHLAHFTPGQIELMGRSRSELEQEARQFSFDIKAFEKRLEQGEDWHKVIQAHLYLDHCTSCALSEALANPDAIRLSRMGFAQKLELIEALALLPNELISAATAINRLRNRVAHELQFEISASDISDLKNATPKHLRDAIHPETSKQRKVTLSDLLKVIVLMVDIMRQRQALARVLNEQAALTLRLTLDVVKPRSR